MNIKIGCLCVAVVILSFFIEKQGQNIKSLEVELKEVQKILKEHDSLIKQILIPNRKKVGEIKGE